MTVVRLTYIEADGAETIVEARPGQSLMEAAVKNGVRGIAADCGGNAACGTC
jgi:2Fe-2S ferredoxin